MNKSMSALRYDTIMVNAEKYAKMINDIVSNKREVKKSLLIKTFDQAVLAYQSLANSTSDSYFKKQVEKLLEEKSKIGIILEGKLTIRNYIKVSQRRAYLVVAHSMV